MVNRLLRTLALVALLFGLTVGAAAAAPTVVDPGAPSLSMCSQQAVANARVDQMASDYLPLNRWGDGFPMHTRLSLLSETKPWIERNLIISNVLGAGNTGWLLGSSATESASRFCVGESTIRVIDQAAGKLGSGLFSSGIVAFAVVVGIALALARAQRGAGMAGVARMALTAGVLVMLVAGAARTTDTEFGKGSPGWWGSRINQAVDVLATAPVGALDSAAMSALAGTSSVTLDSTDCRYYTAALRNLYQDRFGAAAGGSGSVAVAPRTLDSMWQGSGLATWTRVQFGASDYGPKVACRLLERVRGIPVADVGDVKGQLSISQLRPVRGSNVSSPIPNANPQALAWSWRNDEEEDRALVGWAACAVRDGRFVVVGKWDRAGPDGDGVTEKNCEFFFTKSVDDYDGTSSLTADVNGLDYPDDSTIIGWSSQAPEEASFLLNLHGTENRDAKSTAYMFVISGLVVGLTFTFLAVAVFIAKAALVVMGLAVIGMLLAGLLRPQEDSKVVAVGKQYVVIAFFAFASSLMLSMLALITNTLYAVGQQHTSSGGFGSSLWAGLSPVAAIFIFKKLFTMMGAPSPFKPTAALAWGAAAAGTGMLAGVGLERHLARRGSGVARSATRIGERAVSQRLGLRGRRTGAMAAAGGAAAGAATAAAVLDQRKTTQEAEGAEGVEAPRDVDGMEGAETAKAPAPPPRRRALRAAKVAAIGGVVAVTAPVSGPVLAAAGAAYVLGTGARRVVNQRRTRPSAERMAAAAGHADYLESQRAREDSDRRRVEDQRRQRDQERRWAAEEAGLPPDDPELRRRELSDEPIVVRVAPRRVPATPRPREPLL